MISRARHLGLSQADIARRAEVAADAVSKLATGKRWPRRHTLARIEGALSWPVGTLTAIADGADPEPLITKAADHEAVLSESGRFVFDLPAGWDAGMSELQRRATLRRAEAAALDAIAQAQISE